MRVLQAQSRRQAGLLPYAVIDAGPEAIRSACRTLAGHGISLLIADTLAERHLAALARAAVDAPLLTGNSSVAAHLPPVWIERELVSPRAEVGLPGVEGPGAVLAGSVAEQTLGQLAHFAAEHPVLTLDLARAFAGEDLVSEAAAFAARAIKEGRLFAVSTAAPQAEVERLQATHGRAEAAARAEAILSELAHRLVKGLGVRRLIVAGGETSGALVAALGLKGFVVGPYLGPGLSRGVAMTPEPLSLMLKSGKLGGPDIFKTVLEAMRRPLALAPALAGWPPARPLPIPLDTNSKA